MVTWWRWIVYHKITNVCGVQPVYSDNKEQNTVVPQHTPYSCVATNQAHGARLTFGNKHNLNTVAESDLMWSHVH